MVNQGSLKSEQNLRSYIKAFLPPHSIAVCCKEIKKKPSRNTGEIWLTVEWLFGHHRLLQLCLHDHGYLVCRVSFFIHELKKKNQF
jgi:hypothetical protein